MLQKLKWKKEKRTRTEQDCADGSEGDEKRVFALGRDHMTKWKRKPPRKARRRGQDNILTRLSVVIEPAEQTKTVEECCIHFFSNDILDLMVINTNKSINKIKNKFCQRGMLTSQI